VRTLAEARDLVVEVEAGLGILVVTVTAEPT
jgi:hypothetical protein